MVTAFSARHHNRAIHQNARLKREEHQPPVDQRERANAFEAVAFFGEGVVFLGGSTGTTGFRASTPAANLAFNSAAVSRNPQRAGCPKIAHFTGCAAKTGAILGQFRHFESPVAASIDSFRV